MQSCPSDSSLLIAEVMLYLSLSPADFHLRCKQGVTISSTRAHGGHGEAAFTPHSLHRRSGSQDHWVRDSLVRSTLEHRDGKMGTWDLAATGSSPISLKNLAETWDQTLGKGCGDESEHLSRAKGTGTRALPHGRTPGKYWLCI